MVNIDKFLECMRSEQQLPSGEITGGHNFSPLLAHIEDDCLKLPLKCRWCGFTCTNWAKYNGETPQEVKEKYGFELDDPLQSV